MKRYAELTEDEKKRAFEKSKENLLNAILSGELRFNDKLNHDDLQARIDSAIEKAGEDYYKASENVVKSALEEIEGMAQCEIEDAFYPEKDNFVMGGICD